MAIVMKLMNLVHAWKDNEIKFISTVDGHTGEWMPVSLTSTTLKGSLTDDDLFFSEPLLP